MIIYTLRLESVAGVAFDNPLQNIFTYSSDFATPSNAEAGDIADAFSELFFEGTDDFLQLIHSTINFRLIEVLSPFSTEVLVQKVIDFDGIATGSRMPLFTAWEWSCERTRTDIRRGFKRFSTMSEGQVTDGVIDGTYLPLAAVVAGWLGEPLGLASFDYATPCIVKRIPYTAPSGKTAYRLPENESELVLSPALNWSYQRVTTQNSRKR